ncbi:DUF3592 domain-containing protein [Streptomyces marincola]|uniref:DUF3592 domain-containing protein n=1 Tax=Streptomyces marincola TaxID=2878388 RepID=A0A1W7CTC3_9ACTN|nr:DUF3592 domain-containing protein [Streptomyces marincola]ARQ68061.1 hypothetical protein CAG99_03715 [Streptomyces marincola]
MVVAKRCAALIVGAAAIALGGVLLVVVGLLVSDVGSDDWTKPDRPAEAVVTEIVRTRSGGGPIGARTQPRVTYEAEGQRYSSLLRGTTAGRSLDVGNTLRVVYRADDPGRPYTVRGAERGPPGVAGDIVAIVAVLVCALVPLVFGWLLLTVARGRRTSILDP